MFNPTPDEPSPSDKPSPSLEGSSRPNEGNKQRCDNLNLAPAKQTFTYVKDELNKPLDEPAAFDLRAIDESAAFEIDESAAFEIDEPAPFDLRRLGRNPKRLWRNPKRLWKRRTETSTTVWRSSMKRKPKSLVSKRRTKD